MRALVHTDGGSRGNPGPGAYGFVVELENGELLAEGKQFLGTCTNNEAEYRGLIAGLESLRNLIKTTPLSEALVMMDSNLVVQQVNGVWKIKEDRLRELALKARGVMASLPVKVQLMYVPREQNKGADALVNQALDIALL